MGQGWQITDAVNAPEPQKCSKLAFEIFKLLVDACDVLHDDDEEEDDLDM